MYEAELNGGRDDPYRGLVVTYDSPCAMSEAEWVVTESFGSWCDIVARHNPDHELRNVFWGDVRTTGERCGVPRWDRAPRTNALIVTWGT